MAHREVNDQPSLRTDLAFDEPEQYSMNGLISVPSPMDDAMDVPTSSTERGAARCRALLPAGARSSQVLCVSKCARLTRISSDVSGPLVG